MTTTKLERLRKLLILAMSSDNEGESASALRAVRRWMAATRHDAGWVLDNVGAPPPPFVLGTPAVVPWDEQVKYLSEPDSVAMLNDKEMQFVADMLTRWAKGQKHLTLKQAKWMNSIFNRHVLARGVVDAQRR